MRFIDRTSVKPPRSLTKPTLAVKKERDDAKNYYANGKRSPAFAFTQYTNHDVKRQLYKLFLGKCAYCQSEVGAPTDEEIEHYRPKGGVDGDDDHTGYWWLASHWDNLLTSCTGCNQARKHVLVTVGMDEDAISAALDAPPRVLLGKAKHFPVGGIRAKIEADDLDAEDAHLIDPTRRKPEPEFYWCTEHRVSMLLPASRRSGLSPYGATTIKVCGLNRAKLVMARTSLLRQLALFREKLLESLERDSSPHGVRTALLIVDLMKTFAMPDKPFSGMADAYVRSVEKELRVWLTKRRSQAKRAQTMRARVLASTAP